MKKIKILVALCLTVFLMLVSLSACKVSHTHDFSGDWQTDANDHWKECTGDGCNIKDQNGAHVFDNGEVTTPATEAAEGVMTYTCAVCGYEKTEPIAKLPHVHTWESEWSSDATHHWHASSCGHDDKDKAAHIFDDGFIEKPATDTEKGIIIYTCVICEYYYEEELEMLDHKHTYSDEWTFDDDSHWHASTCGHSNVRDLDRHNLGAATVTKEPTEFEEGVTSYFCGTCDYVKTEPIAKLPHTHKYDENNDCVCGYHHDICELCGNCPSDACPDCKSVCQFSDSSKIVTFAPNATYLGEPEGPDGIAPGEAGAYIYDTSIKAEQVVLADGAYATKVTLPNGTASHSGVSFWNNKNIAEAGQAGYNCGIPQYEGVTKVLKLHFTNTGSSSVTFKFSAIDYYYDKGSVTLTLAAGESKTVLMNTVHSRDTVGLNQQIVFPNGADAGASLTIWGEFVAEGLDSAISVSVPAKKLAFYVGEEFSAEGLILSGTSSKGNWTRVYISKNYTTSLDGHTFTSADAGEKTVTVSFAGLTTTYTVTVIDHGVDACSECGKCSNQICDYYGCTEKCQGHFDADSMTVMSFNLGTNGVSNEYNKPNLLNKLVSELPDLLGTQEENSLWTAAIKDTLARYGYKNVIMYRDGVVNSSLGNEGAGIWYNSLRFELIDWGYFWMSDTPNESSIWDQYGALYKRVTTWAKLTDKVNGNTFVYFNTHIGYESEQLWLRTADMIMERMHAVYNEGTPVIITGDFNFALNTEGAMPAYERFMLGLNDSHYEALVKNYEEGKQNTFSGYGQYQGAGDENVSDVGDRAHVLPIDYIMYSDEFIANTYTILREELPLGVTEPNRQYFSSDHFAIKTLFNFVEDFTAHHCWEECDICGLCRDESCALCTEKCPGHHTCDNKCPDCGLCVNADGECKDEYCPQYKVTLVGATFEGGSNVFYGCKLSGTIVTAEGKTFEGFLDADKNYYTIADLSGIDLGGNVKYTALYQEDMLAYAQSDTCAYDTLASAEHRVVNGTVVTTVSYPKGAAAGTFFAGRGSKDSGSMALNWCAPANGKNVAIIYIYSYAQGDVKVQYMTENYGAQNADLFVTLKPGLNRIVLTFGIKGSNDNFYSCDHRLILVEEAAEDIVLDTYGYIYTEGLVDSFAAVSKSGKLIYKPGDVFDVSKISVTAKVNTYLTPLHKFVTSIPAGYVFTAEDIGTKTVTVSMGEHTATIDIEIVDADCESGKHYNIKDTVDANFVGTVGTDAMYNYVCAFCGVKSEETYACDKILFTPHNNIGGGHKIEYVTLADGRIAAKLTFNSDAAAGSKFTITANSYPTGTNITFPVSGAGRLIYMEMLSSADVNLTWQPEFYGDRDAFTLELKANEAKGMSRIVCYDTSTGGHTSSDGPYQEIVCNTAVSAGTVVYFTGYFYTANEVKDISIKTLASKTTFKVGESFSAAGLGLKPTSSNSLFAETVIYNFTTDLDGYEFKASDVGTKLVTVSWGDLTCSYEITVTE